MPNAPVPAAAGGMSKFNRSQIMRDAWAIYRHMTRSARPSTAAGRRNWFARALRGAWETAKQAAAEALKTASQRAAERVAVLKAEIFALDCKPFGIRIGAERTVLSTELATLEAA